MGPVLLREETGVLGENLRCMVESNCSTLFSHMTKITLIRQQHGAEVKPFHPFCVKIIPISADLQLYNTMDFLSLGFLSHWNTPFYKFRSDSLAK